MSYSSAVDAVSSKISEPAEIEFSLMISDPTGGVSSAVEAVSSMI